MRFQALSFLLLLTCMYLSTAQGSFGNCCLRFATGMKQNVKRNVEFYKMQIPDGDCNLRAVVFHMKLRPELATRRTICANPDHQWVRHLMAKVDRRLAN